MIKKLAYALLLAALHSAAQERDAVNAGKPIIISKTLTAYAGEVYLDSIKIDIAKTFLDPDNFKDVRSYKGDQAQIHSGTTGVILITRKKNTKLKSLKDFIAKARSGTIKDVPKVNVVVNGSLIENFEGYFIENSAIKEISVLNNAKKNTDHLHRTPTIVITTKQVKLT